MEIGQLAAAGERVEAGEDGLGSERYGEWWGWSGHTRVQGKRVSAIGRVWLGAGGLIPARSEAEVVGVLAFRRVRRILKHRMASRAFNSGPVYLRLVGDEAVAPAPATARREAARENHLAATLGPVDMRAALAVDVARAIEGGRAAILRPERRRNIIVQAKAMGLREFDANLIIAVVQDAARRGESHSSADVRATLGMIPNGSAADGGTLRAVLATVLAAAIFVALMVWVLGA